MTLCGYVRMSATGQDLPLQREALRAAGCQAVRAAERTGTSRESRAELDLLLQFLSAGDTPMIPAVISRPSTTHLPPGRIIQPQMRTTAPTRTRCGTG